MAGIRIGVSGNADAAKKAVDQMTSAVNDLAKKVADANKVQLKLPGVEQGAKDLAKLNKGFQDALKQSAGLRNAIKNSGQSPSAGILNIDWSKTSLDPKAAQRMRDRAFAFASKGTAWDMTGAPPAPGGGSGGSGGSGGGGGGGGSGGGSGRGGGGRGGRGRGFIARTARSFAGGLGGTAGRVGTGAIEGAEAGAAGAGGIAGGMLTGGLIAAGAATALYVGKSIAEGYDMSKDRAITLDTLKRQMGDLGISFDQLKEATKQVSTSLGINAKEFAEFELQAQQATHGAFSNPDDLKGFTENGLGLARAYGMDPGQTLGMTSALHAVDSHQNYRELATYIADAISRTGGAALPQEVMQAVVSLASATSRLTLTSPNVGAISSSYASMLDHGTPGMTPDNAQAILGTANSNIMRMGAAGEAGQNFIMQAINRGGGTMLNPMEARELAAGGLFGTRSSVFGPDTEFAKYMGDDPRYKSLSGGAGADIQNFEAIRDYIKSSYGGNKELQLDAAQNLFGVGSLNQAAALMNLDSRGYGGLNLSLKTAGVGLDKLDPTGIATLAKIGNASSMDDLNGIYGDLMRRTDIGEADKARLKDAQGSGDFGEFKKAMIQVAANYGQEKTQANDIRSIKSTLDNAKILAGDALLGPVIGIQKGVVAIIGAMTGQRPGDSVLSPYKGDHPDNWFDWVRSSMYGDEPDGVSSQGGVLPQSEVGTAEDPARGPIGARQNNPFNLRPVGKNTGFQSFDNMQGGVNAGVAQLLRYQDKYNLNTVNGIVSRYAPGNENNTKAYIAGVSKDLGIGADDKIDLHNADTLRALSRAMLKQEGNSKYVDDETLIGAVNEVSGPKTVPVEQASGPKSASDTSKYLDDEIRLGTINEAAIQKTPPSRSVMDRIVDGTKIASQWLFDHAKEGGGAEYANKSYYKGVTEGASDKVVLDINLNSDLGGNKSNLKTSVEVPRGSGTQRVAMKATAH